MPFYLQKEMLLCPSHRKPLIKTITGLPLLDMTESRVDIISSKTIVESVSLLESIAEVGTGVIRHAALP